MGTVWLDDVVEWIWRAIKVMALIGLGWWLA